MMEKEKMAMVAINSNVIERVEYPKFLNFMN